MALQIATVDARRAEANSKTTVAIFGPPGVGKTSLLQTLLASTTLCVDLEAGLKSVQDWPGDSIPIRSWLDAVDIAGLIGGVDPAADPSAFFSEAMQALGGHDSPTGSWAWHVLGCQRSIREWAMRQGWGGRALHVQQAQGIALAVLDLLARHFGYRADTAA